jgi:hypothetical protein
VSGTPGDSTSAAKPVQSSVAQVAGLHARAAALATLVGIVVPGEDLGAAGDFSASAVARPEPPSPKTATAFP